MNSRNSKTSDRHRLLINLSGKINLKKSEKYVALSNLSIYHTWNNRKMLHKNNKFKISALIWNKVFEMPDGESDKLCVLRAHVPTCLAHLRAHMTICLAC